MSKRYFAQHEELKRLAALSEIRAAGDDLDKAVCILRTYVGEVKLTKRGICSYFSVSRMALRRRLWSILLGYNQHVKSKNRYLSTKWELHLSDLIDSSRNSGNSVTIDELKLTVM